MSVTQPHQPLSCDPAGGHCATCADEALPARVLARDPAGGLALVQLGAATAEVDISLLGAVQPGDWLLVHGGVALAALDQAPVG